MEEECQPQGARARATEFTFPLLCRDVLRSPLFGWIWRDEKQYVRQNPLCAVEEVDEEQKLAFLEQGIRVITYCLILFILLCSNKTQ